VKARQEQGRNLLATYAVNGGGDTCISLFLRPLCAAFKGRGLAPPVT
jgi:hypothetical protein